MNQSRHFPAVQKLHASIRESLDMMSIGLGVEKRRNDSVGENTSSEDPKTNSKDTGDVRYVCCSLSAIVKLVGKTHMPVQTIDKFLHTLFV